MDYQSFSGNTAVSTVIKWLYIAERNGTVSTFIHHSRLLKYRKKNFWVLFFSPLYNRLSKKVKKLKFVEYSGQSVLPFKPVLRHFSQCLFIFWQDGTWCSTCFSRHTTAACCMRELSTVQMVNIHSHSLMSSSTIITLCSSFSSNF